MPFTKVTFIGLFTLVCFCNEIVVFTDSVLFTINQKWGTMHYNCHKQTKKFTKYKPTKKKTKKILKKKRKKTEDCTKQPKYQTICTN